MIKVDSFSFQGVNGAYSEQAGKNIFPNATSIPCATFEDMFEHVRSGKSEAAMVPIENSLAGRVADTQRLIPDSDLKITYEYFHEVNHNLLGIRGAKISDIKRIRSHEQGIAQCRNKILKLDKQMIVEADTAGSAKLISQLNNIEDGAIASELAANPALTGVWGVPAWDPEGDAPGVVNLNLPVPFRVGLHDLFHVHALQHNTKTAKTLKPC